ncbi:MAG: three-Cys-motif partner protein TcmP [Rhizobiaceae bacterium]|nr:three-Cys-motif partner protein TcmP [Rhizobiaceae bacterium]
MADSDGLFGKLPDQLVPQPVIQSGLEPVWTQHKAQLIAKYIFLFTIITRHGVYIDGFAGPKNIKLPDSWSAKLVTETEPRRLRALFFCDQDTNKIKHLEKMVSEQPDFGKRDYKIISGDFNKIVKDILGSGKIKEKVATFCLIDQFAVECHWSTLRLIAEHKPAPARKIELFYFLATGWLGRSLGGHTRNLDRPELWWGDDSWKSLIGTTGQQVAVKMSERFRDELGYRHVRPYPIFARDKGGGQDHVSHDPR